ncbi:MAG: thiol:disulfide interchange protein DsbA/DsbL [Proteobacteria bacterium]|jgi:thiol:disulfide interchange protein DsbA|nr:thiol:disulfide interchange protein DsbA/DsbL [Pseudomonadota bacterium]
MLNTWLKRLLISTTLLAASLAHAEIREGVEYKKMAKPQAVAVAGKSEVIEFFWYGCPHCFTVAPYVEDWASKLPANVNFRRIHVAWPGRSDMEGHAKIFIALQAMGLEGKQQLAVMTAVQKDRIELRKEDVLFDWIKKQGIDVEKFKAQYNSFSSSANMNKLAQMTRDYQVDGVPMFVVNGKYVTSPAMFGKEDGTITQVINELLAKDKPAVANPKKK